MQSRITGTTMPVLEFQLDPNDAIIPKPENSPGWAAPFR